MKNTTKFWRKVQEESSMISRRSWLKHLCLLSAEMGIAWCRRSLSTRFQGLKENGGPFSSRSLRKEKG